MDTPKDPAGRPTAPNPISTDQVHVIQREHEEAARARERDLLGAIARDQSLPLAAQVQNILKAQAYTHLREEDLLFGKLAVRHGFARDAEVREALRLQDSAYGRDGRLPRRLGEILIAQGVLTPQEMEALLEIQRRLRKDATVRLGRS